MNNAVNYTIYRLVLTYDISEIILLTAVVVFASKYIKINIVFMKRNQAWKVMVYTLAFFLLLLLNLRLNVCLLKTKQH